jgi:16S rRNA G1207 methylase RsmC
MRCVTGEHYFTAVPGAPERRGEIDFSIDGKEYRLAVAGGVFSGDRLDPGTRVLLRKADRPAPDEAGPLLDLGCGYGPIACVLADRAPKAVVYALDVNTRALDLVRENAGAHDGRVRPVLPEEVPAEVAFSQIWSNPPIRIGKAELHDLLGRWLPRLRPDGVAWLVVARHLGGDSLQKWLAEQGWHVERHASQKGYRVLRVTK